VRDERRILKNIQWDPPDKETTEYTLTNRQTDASRTKITH
jgi:hypothetical protein